MVAGGRPCLRPHLPVKTEERHTFAINPLNVRSHLTFFGCTLCPARLQQQPVTVASRYLLAHSPPRRAFPRSRLCQNSSPDRSAFRHFPCTQHREPLRAQCYGLTIDLIPILAMPAPLAALHFQTRVCRRDLDQDTFGHRSCFAFGDGHDIVYVVGSKNPNAFPSQRLWTRYRLLLVLLSPW